MDTARLFQSEVIVKHFGNGLMLLLIEDPWQTLEAHW
jgi:antitoxin VapB